VRIGQVRLGALGLVAVGVAAIALAGTGIAQAKTWPPDVRRCALGRLPAPVRAWLPKAIAVRERRFAASLEGVSGSERARAEALFARGAAAYLYGMPTVLVRRTVERFGLNLLVGIGELATPETRTVVLPNHDTLYSVSRLDLGTGPLMIDAPATGGRYSVLQLLDAYTNIAGYVGSGSERDHDRTVAVVPPGWRGSLPPDVRVIRSPTKLVWLLGRTLVDGQDDLAAATELIGGYSLTPLAAWLTGERNPAIVLPAFPDTPPVELPRGVAFYDALGGALAADPPPSRDDCALRAFARAGIGPGLTPSASSDPIVIEALQAAARAGDRLVDRALSRILYRSRRRHNGWGFWPANTGRFGVDYVDRAVVAAGALGANVPSEAIYPSADSDRRGRPLSGRDDYVVSFSAGELPPVRTFWSMTLYGRDLFLVPNELGRYTVGDRTEGLHYGPGRSLKIYVQHEAPRGRRRANWLPAPAGRFLLVIRLFEPRRAAIGGRWTPPRISRTG
jgi:hypothetical protein